MTKFLIAAGAVAAAVIAGPAMAATITSSGAVSPVAELANGAAGVKQAAALVSQVFGSVPEPETWVSMLAGFGFVGVIARISRRRRAPVTTA